jgi:GNAT superfamily N-acetyltransferase
MPGGTRPGRRAGRGRRRATTARRTGPSAAFRLRPIRRKDGPLLVLHRRKMWEEISDHPRGELDRADAPYLRWIGVERARGRLRGFVAEDPDGTVLGSGLLWLQPSQPRPGPLGRGTMPYVLSMYTEPAARSRGIASAIVRAMVDWAVRAGYRRLFLHASRFGRPVYARLGFKEGNEMRLDLPARPRRRR